MSMRKKLTVIFTVLATITLAIFVMLLYKKFEYWVSTTIGDGNWTIIIVGLFLVLFIVAGLITGKKIKNKFGW